MVLLITTKSKTRYGVPSYSGGSKENQAMKNMGDAWWDQVHPQVSRKENYQEANACWRVGEVRGKNPAGKTTFIVFFWATRRLPSWGIDLWTRLWQLKSLGAVQHHWNNCFGDGVWIRTYRNSPWFMASPSRIPFACLTRQVGCGKISHQARKPRGSSILPMAGDPLATLLSALWEFRGTEADKAPIPRP